jgi:hypothetical protein
MKPLIHASSLTSTTHVSCPPGIARSLPAGPAGPEEQIAALSLEEGGGAKGARRPGAEGAKGGGGGGAAAGAGAVGRADTGLEVHQGIRDREVGVIVCCFINYCYYYIVV